jgi:hypothetical protein
MKHALGPESGGVGRGLDQRQGATSHEPAPEPGKGAIPRTEQRHPGGHEHQPDEKLLAHAKQVDGGEGPGAEEREQQTTDQPLGRTHQASVRPMQGPGALHQVEHGQALRGHEEEERDLLEAQRGLEQPEREGHRDGQEVVDPAPHPGRDRVPGQGAPQDQEEGHDEGHRRDLDPDAPAPEYEFHVRGYRAHHSVAQHVGDLLDHVVGVLAEVVLHTEDDLDRVVVEEEPARQHDRGNRRHPRPELGLDGGRAWTLPHEGLEALGHLGVVAADVFALELHDVHVDQGHVGLVLSDALPRGAPQGFKIIRKGAAGKGPVERKVGGGQDGEIPVEQGAEDRFLVREEVVHVPRRQARRLGDLTDVGAAVPLLGEKPEGLVEDLFPTAIRSLLLKHGADYRRPRGGAEARRAVVFSLRPFR